MTLMDNLHHRDVRLNFDSAYYLANNPDVAEAVKNGTVLSAFQHFIQQGHKENRNPNGFFNSQQYVSAFGDIAAAIQNGSLESAFVHFDASGYLEGRNTMPSPNASMQDIGSSALESRSARLQNEMQVYEILIHHMEHNPGHQVVFPDHFEQFPQGLKDDVEEFNKLVLLQTTNIITGYLGRDGLFYSREGPKPLDNLEQYQQDYILLKAKFQNKPLEIRSELQQIGSTQERIGKGEIAFDPNTYMALNPDVAAAVQAGQTNPIEHFVLHGVHEGRQWF